ncbi:site-2 protease family protein [bacterium]|nr:site-2 protease family protein [bacterium]
MIETSFILGLIILIFSVVIHEIAHGAIANSLGDNTAEREGRLSLNPIVHIDPIGSVLLPFLLVITSSPVLFGWAKPVPVNFFNLNDKWGELKVALAGPAVNFFIALIFCVFLRFSFFPEMSDIFMYVAIINIGLALFNLIPVFPLDGSHILLNLLPDSMVHFKQFMVNYGALLLIFFIFVFPGTEWLSDLINIIFNLLVR